MAGSKNNFFKDHYDWLVALVGLALLGGIGFLYVSSMKNTPEAASAACEAELKATNKPAHKDVPTAETNLATLEKVLEDFTNATVLVDVKNVEGSFLASEHRVRCKKCRRPIPVKNKATTKNENEPWVCSWTDCRFEQPMEKPGDLERTGADQDDDGMPDAWEKKFGFNPKDPADADQDADGDLFTNLEEFKAGTDPKDPENHPDYLDDLTIAGALDTKTLPFWISNVTPMSGNNFRVWFEATDPKYVNSKNSPKSSKVNAVKDQEVAFMLKGAKWNAAPEPSGWVVVKVVKDTKKIKKEGAGQESSEDVYTVDLKRKSDNRVITVPWKVESFAIEEQMDLRWDRGEASKTFTVAKGTEFELNKRKYKVKDIKKGSVTILDLKTEKNRTIRDGALESKADEKQPSASKPSAKPKPKPKPKK